MPPHSNPQYPDYGHAEYPTANDWYADETYSPQQQQFPQQPVLVADGGPLGGCRLPNSGLGGAFLSDAAAPSSSPSPMWSLQVNL